MAHVVPNSTASFAVTIAPSGTRAPLAQARVESCCRVGPSLRRTARTIPIVPELLTAFAAFSHGTEFATPTGPGIAVEDIEPGMELRTMDGESTQVLWVGMLDMTPQMARRLFADGTAPLVRVLPDRFGYARPARDLILGAKAQVDVFGNLGLAEDLVDFEQVLPVTPPGPVRLFQVVCDRAHVQLIANGLGVPAFMLGSWLDQQDLYLKTQTTRINLRMVSVMKPCSSRVRTRRRQGGAEIPTRLASSTFVIRPSA